MRSNRFRIKVMGKVHGVSMDFQPTFTSAGGPRNGAVVKAEARGTAPVDRLIEPNYPQTILISGKPSLPNCSYDNIIVSHEEFKSVIFGIKERAFQDMKFPGKSAEKGMVSTKEPEQLQVFSTILFIFKFVAIRYHKLKKNTRRTSAAQIQESGRRIICGAGNERVKALLPQIAQNEFLINPGETLQYDSKGPLPRKRVWKENEEGEEDTPPAATGPVAASSLASELVNIVGMPGCSEVRIFEHEADGGANSASLSAFQWRPRANELQSCPSSEVVDLIPQSMKVTGDDSEAHFNPLQSTQLAQVVVVAVDTRRRVVPVRIARKNKRTERLIERTEVCGENVKEFYLFSKKSAFYAKLGS
ncbi:hypothetical protein WH47_02927 [Habropoda laboriosa]|uniref:Uncharacterized protein n=1 Tax=Habropoda laboriosa TaxID=597456 RepID=A0A0L7QYA6_9HYME|nr:hypothetical protein WH47_02927 [Habropoda laboriosa]